MAMKGNGHVERPLACDFEQIVWRPLCRELGDIPSSTLYHYLHADGSLKEPGRKLLDR